MSVPMEECNMNMGVDPQSTITPNWTIDVSEVRTVKVSNISLAASITNIEEFFSFSGHVAYVEMQSESESSQLAYVTFKDSQGADTAVLLSGSNIVDSAVIITPVENYWLPPEALKHTLEETPSPTNAAIRTTEDVVSSMLAKGFVLGKDALKRARSFDERHHLLSTASITIASLDNRIGLSEKISTSTAMVSEKVREVDEQLQVSEITKSALAATEQMANNAGSAIMSNPYVSSGASWVSSAFSKMVQAAEDISTMTKEKVERAEEERKEVICMQQREIVSDFAQVYLDESPVSDPSMVPVVSEDEKSLQII